MAGPVFQGLTFSSEPSVWALWSEHARMYIQSSPNCRCVVVQTRLHEEDALSILGVTIDTSTNTLYVDDP